MTPLEFFFFHFAIFSALFSCIRLVVYLIQRKRKEGNSND